MGSFVTKAFFAKEAEKAMESHIQKQGKRYTKGHLKTMSMKGRGSFTKSEEQGNMRVSYQKESHMAME